MSIDEKWVDIVPPVASIPTTDSITIGIFVSLVVAIAVGIYLYRRPRWRARRSLRRLAHDLQHSRVESRQACFRIQQCLRDGFRWHRLQTLQWTDSSHADWLVFLNRLTQYCYAAGSPDVAELQGVLHEALSWLNKKAVTT